MTPKHMQLRLQGQTSIAQKIFTFVPVQEAWTPGEIHAQLRKAGINRDFRVVSGCLQTLQEAGLIKVVDGGTKYQRDPMPELVPLPRPKKPAPQRVQPQSIETQVEETEVKTKNANQQAPAPAAAPVSVIDALATYANSLRAEAARLNAMADELEVVALQIEEKHEEQLSQFKAEVQKLQQLRNLLQGI